MTVDAGGLDYKIRAHGDFKDLKNFKQLIHDTKKEMKDLIALRKRAGVDRGSPAAAKRKANAVEKEQTDILKRQVRVRREMKALQRESLQNMKTQVAKQREMVAARRAMEVQRNKGVKNLRKELAISRDLQRIEINTAKAKNKKIQAAKKQLSVEQQIARFKEKQAKFEELAKYARSKGLAGNQQALSDLGFSKARAQGAGLLNLPNKSPQGKIAAITASLQKLRKVSDRVGASVTRLFTALVFFSVARGVVNGIRQMVIGMVEFNKNLETARLGIASLLISVNQVVDAQGNLVEGSKALAVAQKISRGQLTLLRKEALKTAATFDELVFAFQVAIAPGTQAGLSVDQIRNFAVQVSQAAGGIGLPQNQLAEELRSLLKGTITPRNTQIATALNISPEDIKRAKEAGKLVDFLNEKFAGFKTASEEALNTFQAIFTNLKDAILLVSGAGGIEFFETLKDTLKSLKDELVIEGPNGIAPSPEALKAFQELGDSLTRIVKMFQELAGNGTSGVLATALALIGRTLEFIAGVIAGIIDGVLVLGKVLNPLLKILGGGNTGRAIGRLIVLAGVLKVLPYRLLWKTLVFAGRFLRAAPLYGTALVLIVGTLVQQMYSLRDSIGVINDETATLKETFDVFVATASGELLKLGLVFVDIFMTVKSNIKRTYLASKELFFSLSQLILTSIGDILGSIISNVKQAWYGASELLYSGLSLLFKWIGDLSAKMTQTIFNGLKVIIDKILGLVRKLPKSVFKFLPVDKDETVLALAQLSTTLRSLAENSKRPFKNLTDGLDDLARSSKNAAEEAAKPKANIFADGISFFSGKAKGAKDAYDQELKDYELHLEKLKRARKKVEESTQKEINELITASEERRGGRKPIVSPGLIQAQVERLDVETAGGLARRFQRDVDQESQFKSDLKSAKESLEMAKINARLSGRSQKEAIINMKSINRQNEALIMNKRELALLEQAELERQNTLTKAREKASPRVQRLASQLMGIEGTEAQAEYLKNQKISESTIKKVVDYAILLEQTQIATAVAEKERTDLLRLQGEIKKDNLELTQLELEALDAGKTVLTGMSKAWTEFVDALPDKYDAALEITRAALTGFASAISGTILDALDPAKNGSDIKNRWRNFFRSLANTVITTMVSTMVEGLVTDLSSGSGGFMDGLYDVLSAIGVFAKGGHVQGFAHGGGVHGFGRAKDPRDTVPAWLRPGEFVVRPEVVSKVGLGFMEALNSGLNPLTSLSGLSGIASATKARSAPLSMATGGPVPTASAGSREPSMNILPVMVAGEAQLEQLINSGTSAFRNAMRANSDVISMSQRGDRRV